MGFPFNPTDGTTYTNNFGLQYRYDATRTAWIINNQVVESNIRSFTWVVNTPIVGGVSGPKLYEDMTAVRISSFVTDATNCVFNIQDRTTAPNTAGLTLMAADQTAITAGVDSTTLQNALCPANSWLYLDIKSVSGTPAELMVTLAGAVAI